MLDLPLKLVDATGVNQADLAYFPDFFIAGPQRTATTWLADALRAHPNVFMPPEKEIYFFNLLELPDHPMRQSNSLAWYLEHFQRGVLEQTKECLRSLKTYGELQRPWLRGEGTASYATMSREVLEEVRQLKPDLKAVFIIRDPVQRAWSHAKKDLCREMGRSVKEAPEDEFIRFFSDPYQLSCAEYCRNIDRWRDVFSDQQILVLNFDQISSFPADVLQQVTAFLGLPYREKYFSSEVLRQKNSSLKGEPKQPPEPYLTYLNELFAEEKRRIAERYGWTLNG